MRINPNLFELPLDQQNKIQDALEHDNYLAGRHNTLVHYVNEHYKAPASYRSIDDPRYVPPTPNEIKNVVQHLVDNHSRGVLSKMIGTAIRTVDRWCSGENTIPYPAWRLLLILDGRVSQFNRIPDCDGSRAWEKYYEKPTAIAVNLDEFTEMLEQVVELAGDSKYKLVLNDGNLEIRDDLINDDDFVVIDCGSLPSGTTAKRILNKRLYNSAFTTNNASYQLKLTKNR